MPAGLTSPVHLLVIMVVAMVVLGPEKLPQAMRQAGKFVAEVRRWSSVVSVDLQDVLSLDTEPSASPVTPPEPATNGSGVRELPPPAALSLPATTAASTPDTLSKPALSVGGEWSDSTPSTNDDPVPPALKEGGEWSDPR